MVQMLIIWHIQPIHIHTTVHSHKHKDTLLLYTSKPIITTCIIIKLEYTRFEHNTQPDAFDEYKQLMQWHKHIVLFIYLGTLLVIQKQQILIPEIILLGNLLIIIIIRKFAQPKMFMHYVKSNNYLFVFMRITTFRTMLE